MTTTNTEKRFIRLGEREYEIGSQAHLDAIEVTHKATYTDLQKKIDEHAGRLDAAEKAVTKAQDELEGEKKKSREADKENEKTLAARVKSRVRLVMKALRLFGEDDSEEDEDKKMDALCEMSERELHLKAIKKADPDFRADGKSDDYVAGKFEGAVSFLSNDKGVDGVVRAVEESKRHFDASDRDRGEHPVAKARRENHDRMHGLSKGGAR